MKKCICGKTENLEKHHIKPKSEGGQDDRANLLWLCHDCHKFVHRKGSFNKNLQRLKIKYNNIIK